MAVLMASLNGLYIASFPQKMGHHIICYEYRQIFLTTVTVPTSKKRLSGGARVVKHAPLARVQGEQHTFPNQTHTSMKWPIFVCVWLGKVCCSPNQTHTSMKWPIFAVFVSLSLIRSLQASVLKHNSSANPLLLSSTIDQASRRHIFAGMSHSLVDGDLVLGLPSQTPAKQDFS